MGETARPLAYAMNPEVVDSALETSAKAVGTMYADLQPHERAAFVPKLLSKIYNGELRAEASAVQIAVAAITRIPELERDIVIQATILALEEERQRIL